MCDERIRPAVLDADRFVVFCLSEASSKEAVMRTHERAGHPTDEVYEITATA